MLPRACLFVRPLAFFVSFKLPCGHGGVEWRLRARHHLLRGHLPFWELLRGLPHRLQRLLFKHQLLEVSQRLPAAGLHLRCAGRWWGGCSRFCCQSVT